MKRIRIVLLTFVLISVIGFTIPLYGKSALTPNRWDVEKLDGTNTAEEMELTCHEKPNDNSDNGETESSNDDSSHIVQGGETQWHYVIDDAYVHPDGFYPLFFTCIYKGLHGNIWIGLDQEYGFDSHNDGGTPNDFDDDEWYFSYYWTPDGILIPDSGYPDDYYMPKGYVDVVTAQDLKEVLTEFDNNIHDTDTMYFGMYDNTRAGYLGDYKTQIFVFNIWDQFFFDPIGAGGFIEGYFWSEIARVFDTNAFHMDTFQWWRRQGESPPMESLGVDYSYLNVRAWEYEGTFAHEFQHLIHNDVDPDEEYWVDEGCATLAEWLCGYGFSPGHISEYLKWFWDTPLVVWEGYLADYGASFLWTFYMYEHYGFKRHKYNGLIWDLVHEQANGIEGWSNVLAAHKVKRSFDQIFQDWSIANYLDDISLAKGRYGYYALDLPSDDSDGWSIPEVMWTWANTPEVFLGEDWEGLGWLWPWHVNTYPFGGEAFPYYLWRGLPYTVNYVEFTDTPWLFEVNFDGADSCGGAPTSGTHNWYSGGDMWAWFTLSQDFVIPAAGATLYFSNYFSIESFWDYGYVEVFDHNTGLWTTLAGLGTTTDYQHPQDNEDIPDDREPFTYSDSGNWNCFTGDSGGLYTEMMDLTPFAGHTIEISFTYWTDGYELGSGWFIDDIEIPEIGFYDDCETEGAWIYSGWYLNDEIIYNNYEVSFIKTTTYYKRNGNPWKSWTSVNKMRLDEDTEEGRKVILAPNNKRVTTSIVMVVANQPGYEHTFGTNYAFTADEFHWHWCHCK